MTKRTLSCYKIALLLFFCLMPFLNVSGIESVLDNCFLNDSLVTDTNSVSRPARRQRGNTSDSLFLNEQSPVIHVAEPEIRDSVSKATLSPILETNESKRDKPKKKHSATKAAMLSATLPGLGQIYNQKYWKVPIVYIGLGAVAYFVDLNNTEYLKWRKAYIYRVDGNPNTVDDFPNYSTEVLNRAMNYYRRNLEISYIAGGVVYLLNILDASVDAHLFDFDVSEDLTLNLQPGFVPIYNGSNYKGVATGISLRVKF